jgi:hypothetical protein
MELSGQFHAPAALHRGNRLQYQMYRRLGGTKSRCGRCGEETNLAPAVNQTPAVQPVARRYINWASPTPQ